MSAVRTVICYEDNVKGFGAFEVKEGFNMSDVEALAHELYGQWFDQFVVLKNGSSNPEVVTQWRRPRQLVRLLGPAAQWQTADQLLAGRAEKTAHEFIDGPCAIVHKGFGK